MRWLDEFKRDPFIYMFISVAALLLGSFILWLFFSIVDQTGTKGIPTEATVIGKDFIPAHSTTTMIMSGKSMIPVITNHPDRYTINVTTKDVNVVCNVDEEMYNMVNRGDVVEVILYIGRISGDVYCD